MMDDDKTRTATMMMVKVNNQTPEIRVIFYDGEREMELGTVEILPIMTFKLLQSTLSNKISISPNHITIYLDRNAAHHQHRRRHPVTSKFDFDALRSASATGCFFWVVLKRGRRNRRRHNKTDTDVVKMILPRGVVDNWGYLEYVNRLRIIDEIEREKERYLMSLNLNSNVYNDLSGYHNRNYYSDGYEFDAEIASCSTSTTTTTTTTGGGSSETATRVYCDVCYNSSSSSWGETGVPFHWCKNDVVVTTNRARSTVGPIAPPLKNGLCA